MSWYHWLAIASLVYCLILLFRHVIILIRAGSPKDYSKQRGDTAKAIQYAMTGATSPKKKESAFLHLPTYIAGLIYHMGTFVALFVFILLLFGLDFNQKISVFLSAFFAVSGLCGLGILIKRFSKQQLHYLSNADDYLSNILVTLAQFATAWVIYQPGIENVYFVTVSLLLIYIPVGKLKHVVYFFAARYHLGFFYGWRGVWPYKGS